MAKKRKHTEHWKPEPDDHDFPAATDYLTLLFPAAMASALVEELRGAETVFRKAKDLMRASRLPLLPADDPEVTKDLERVQDGALLSPVLLVRGNPQAGTALIIADGYHRISASYHLDEDAEIPCRLADPPPGG